MDRRAHVFPVARMTLPSLTAVGSWTTLPPSGLVGVLRKSVKLSEAARCSGDGAPELVCDSVGLYGVSTGASGSPTSPSSNSSLGSTSSIWPGVASAPSVSVTRRPLASPDREATDAPIAVAQQQTQQTATATATAKRPAVESKVLRQVGHRRTTVPSRGF